MTNDEWACRSSIRHSEFVIQGRLHEPIRQPVEQFGMRRRRALRAKIIFRFDESAPEILLPDAVDLHAGGQRILRVHNPASQIEARGKWRNGILRQSISVPP